MDKIKQIESDILFHLKERRSNLPNATYLQLEDVKLISDGMRVYWKKHCGEVPAKIEAILELAEGIMEPDRVRRKSRMQDALSVLSGVGGIGAVAWSVSFFSSLGWWGALMVAVFGVPLGPIAWGVGGTLLVGASIWGLSSKRHKKKASEQAWEVLTKGTVKILPEVWKEYESKWID